MTTKNQYIAEARAANPYPQFAQINGEPVQLTKDEYEANLEAWAEMRVAQDEHQREIDERNAALQSAEGKLAALGLTPEEIAAFLG